MLPVNQQVFKQPQEVALLSPLLGFFLSQGVGDRQVGGVCRLPSSGDRNVNEAACEMTLQRRVRSSLEVSNSFN